jgi:AcrR family transcriptional regulator
MPNKMIKNYNTNRIKKRITDATIEVIKEKGVDEATVREIATKAGLTTGAIYHYYKNKDEVLYDVLHQSLHFSHKITENQQTKSKGQKEILDEISDRISQRLSKTDEQRLYLLLVSDAIAKNGELKDQYCENYKKILNETGDLFYYAFGIENSEMKTKIASILVAALDGIAIQQSLGALPEETHKMIETFTDFFKESVPIFLEKHKKL